MSISHRISPRMLVTSALIIISVIVATFIIVTMTRGARDETNHNQTYTISEQFLHDQGISSMRDQHCQIKSTSTCQQWREIFTTSTSSSEKEVTYTMDQVDHHGLLKRSSHRITLIPTPSGHATRPTQSPLSATR
jgi:hypothetical protein